MEIQSIHTEIIFNADDKWYIFLLWRELNTTTKCYKCDDIDKEKCINCISKSKEINNILNNLKIQKSNIDIENKKLCCICFNNNCNFLSSCNHTYCLECFLMWRIVHDKNSCYSCMKEIHLSKCKIKI